LYSYPEETDLKADKVSFISLCSSVFLPHVEVDKALHLGRRLKGEHRPLLIRR